MKFERIKSMPQLKQEIISYLFDAVAKKAVNHWYKISGKFEYEGQRYDIECDCKYDNQMFTYKNLLISHEQITLLVDDVNRGILRGFKLGNLK